MSAKLGEILVRENLISPQHLRQALDYQREHGGRLGYNLVKLGLVSDDTITAILSRQYGIPSVNLDLFNIEDSVLRLIPQEVAQKYSVLPLSRVGATLTLAMVDPTNVFAMDDIKFMTGLNVEPVVVAEASIQAAIARYYSTSREIEVASVAADASLAEGQRHPRLEVLDHPRRHLRVLVEVVVQAVGPRIHQGLEPFRARRVLRLHAVRIDEELHPEIAVDRRLSLGFCQPPHRVDEVRLHAIEVVLGLRVDQPEHGVGVGLSVNVRNAPVVANDRDVLRLLLPADRILRRGALRERDTRRADENELFHGH